jgi:hypothetical protein
VKLDPLSMHMSLSIMNIKFDLNNPYILIKEKIKRMIDERDDAIDNEPLDEANNVQIGDVVIDRVGFNGC